MEQLEREIVIYCDKKTVTKKRTIHFIIRKLLNKNFVVRDGRVRIWLSWLNRHTF